MTVGEALAKARTIAGLSVDDVSERTKIREVVIRGIERDDFDACGGDLFVRGYVRVIANAVGIDAQPLIREYDQSHPRGEPVATIAPVLPERQAPEAAEPEAAVTEPDAPEVTELDAAEPGEPAAAAVPPPSPGRELVPSPGRDLVPIRIQPGPPLHPSLTRRTWRGWLRDRRRSVAVLVLALVVLVAAAIAGAQVVSGAGASGTNPANSGPAHHAPVNQAAGVSDQNPASHAKAAPRRKRGATGSHAPVRQLAVPLAEAFGPDGTANGDNPSIALNAVSPGAAQPWTTHWYTSPRFGGLKPGTGLLLDMGRTVTVTRVAVDLGTGSGVNLQLRAGSAPGALRTTATATGVGGNVVLHLSKPVRARYLMVWFTTLSAVGNGQYQVSVYHVTVDGRP